MWRWIAAGTAVVVLAGAWFTGVVGLPQGTGYFTPLFSPDGRTIYAIRRDAAAVTLGFGYEFFTPPASVYVRDDRYALLAIAPSGGRQTVLDRLPTSPLAGRRLSAYHGAIFGSASTHLRWNNGRLLYEVALTRYDSPLSRTFVARGAWDPATSRVVDAPEWKEAGSIGGGDEPEQLAGRLEVIALPGGEGLPCGVVTLDRDTHAVTPLVMTSTCRARFPAGVTAADVAPLSRRPDIERAQTITQTYAALVARGIASGVNEGTAMLQANKEMERLGYFPRTPSLTATKTTCAADGPPTFEISDEELRVGLFQDIGNALAHPGEAVDKESGDYIRHQSFDTSQRINDYLADRGHTTFVVKRGQTCWLMAIRS